MSENEEKEFLVRAQATPNPNAIKFVTNQTLKQGSQTIVETKEEVSEIPMLKDLMSLPGVTQLYLNDRALTVSHDGSNNTVEDEVISVLKTRITIHDPFFMLPEEESAPEKVDRSDLSPEMQKLEEILDRTIRPGLQSDGGDIEVINFENDEMRIIFQGACGGCPSAMMGTLDAIQNIVRNELQNPDIMVIPI